MQEYFKNELLDAASKGDNSKIKRLLKAGADIEARGKYDGYTALIWAARNNHTETCRLLIKRGANIETKDKEGMSALMWATSFGNTETAELLKLYLVRKMLDRKDADSFLSSFEECIQ
jgi:ankyrin repeat protein